MTISNASLARIAHSTKHVEFSSIVIGDFVQCVFPWREDELPNDSNFHYGKVTNRFYRTNANSELLYFNVEGLENPVPMSRVNLIERAK